MWVLGGGELPAPRISGRWGASGSDLCALLGGWAAHTGRGEVGEFSFQARRKRDLARCSDYLRVLV